MLSPAANSQMGTQQLRDELRAVLTTQDPPPGFASLQSYLLGRGEEILSHLYHADPAAPPVVASGGEAQNAELARLLKEHEGISALPCFVRPAGDYDGWCLVGEADKGQDDGIYHSMDFANFADESLARLTAAALNALPRLLTQAPAARSAVLGGVGQASKWTAVSERLPQPGTTNWVAMLPPNGKYRIVRAFMLPIGYWDEFCPEWITHWQPYYVAEPAAPSSEAEEGGATSLVTTVGGPVGWVSVDERLPETDGEYLIYGNCTGSGEHVDIAKFDTFGSDPRGPKIFRKHNQPTHWQPLPAAPASESKEANGAAPTGKGGDDAA